MDSSSKLESLSVMKCYSITGNGLVQALKRLPFLETLDLFYISGVRIYLFFVFANIKRFKHNFKFFGAQKYKTYLTKHKKVNQ